MPVEALIARVLAAGGKGRAELLLREVKEATAGVAEARRPTFRTSGTREQVADAIREAVRTHVLPTHRLAALVDALEENGGQHIFLYTLTDAGARSLTAAALGRRLHGPPAAPTEAYYADEPVRRTTLESRAGVLVVKQIYVAEYWERNENESSETVDRRVTVMDRVRRRAVNLVRIRPALREVEVRIDRARPEHDPKLALELFDDFQESLDGIVDFDADLDALAIWRGFRAIIAARAETYMSTDEGYDPTVMQRLSNRRGGRHGADIRDHGKFSADNSRDQLNVWWKLPRLAGEAPDADDRYLHTVMLRLEARDEHPDRAKVYVGAKAEPADLDYALGRIRHFAR